MFNRSFHTTIIKLAREIHEDVREIRKYLLRAKSATLTIKTEDLMSASIVVGGKGAQATFTEFDGLDGTGSKVAPVGTVQFGTSDASVATVDSNGVVTAVAPGTATITGMDQGNSLQASDTVTVTAAGANPAQSATLVVTAN